MQKDHRGRAWPRKLGVNNAGLPPMADAFDPSQSHWTFQATPAPILFNPTLPITPPAGLNLALIPQPTRDAAMWVERTKNFDFSQEDGVIRKCLTGLSGRV